MRQSTWWRGFAGVFFAIFLILITGLPVQGSYKADQGLTCVPSLTLPFTEESFPLSMLEASSLAGEDVRLTYLVESGGDVIRIQGDRVQIIGMGNARIRVFADETATHRAAEQTVSILIFRSPRIHTGFSYDLDGALRLYIEVDPGSYRLEDLRDWSFSYRRAGDSAYTSIPVGAPSVFPFYILPGRLAGGVEYEFLVSAVVYGQNGEEETLASRRRLHAPADGGTLVGSITGHPGGTVQVSLSSGGVVYGGWRGVAGSSFTMRGVPDGIYQLEATDNTRTVTASVEMVDGEPVEPPTLYMGGGSSIVEYITEDAPAVTVGGLDALAGSESPGDGTRVEYRLAVAAATSAPIGAESIRQAADVSETVGPYLDLALHQLHLDGMGRILEERFLEDLGENRLDILYPLPEEYRGMDGYRVLVCLPGGPVPLDCDYDPEAGTLRFSTSSLATVAVLYQHPGRGIGGVAPDTESSAAEVMLPVELDEEIVAELRTQAAFGITLPAVIGSALAALALALFIGRRLAGLHQKKEPPAPPLPPDPPPVKGTPAGTKAAPPVLRQRPAPPPSLPLPEKEHRFFHGIEERQRLRQQLANGEITQEEFRELEREILMKM